MDRALLATGGPEKGHPRVARGAGTFPSYAFKNFGMGVVIFSSPDWALLRTLAWIALGLTQAADFAMRFRLKSKVR